MDVRVWRSEGPRDLPEGIPGQCTKCKGKLKWKVVSGIPALVCRSCQRIEKIII